MAISKSDILDFTVKLSLAGAASATVNVDNSNGDYSVYVNDLRGRVVTLRVIQDALSYIVFKGIIKKVVPSYDINGNKIASVELVSVFDFLSKKPIASETVDLDGAVLLNYLLQNYGGIAASYVDIVQDGSEHFSNVIVAENSIIDAVKKIAEACNVELFTNNQGKLVTAIKKDNSSGVDVTLTTDHISSSISEEVMDDDLPSVVKVRGRYLAGSDEVVTIVSTITVKVVPVSSTIAYATITPDIDITEGQIETSSVVIIAGATSGLVFKTTEDGRIVIKFTGSFTAGVITPITFYVNGKPDLSNDIDATQETIGEGIGETIKFRKNMTLMISDTALKRPVRDSQILKRANESSRTRIETMVKHQTTVDNKGTVFH